MKLKPIKKLVACLMCMAVLAGSLPAAFWPSARAAETGVLGNGDFETTQPQDGSIPGWTVEDSSGSVAQSDADVHGGAYSLELTDTGAGDSPLVRSDSIPVSAGDKVTAGVWADVGEYDGSAAYVDAVFSVWYCDVDGNRIGQAYGPDIQTNGGWTQYSSGELTVPTQSNGTDVAGVCVAFYGSKDGECKAYFDAAELNVERASDDASVTNGDFETEPAGGEISGWTVEDGSGSIAQSGENVHGGTYSLELVDTGDTQSPLVRSSSIPVSPGDKVTASVWADVQKYDESGTGVDAIFSVWYCDADGNRIGQAWGPDNGVNGGWSQYSSGELTVPAQSGGTDVAGVCVAFYGGSGSECKAYFDDVETAIVRNSGSLLTNGDFEASQPQDVSIPGWTVEDSSGSVAQSDADVHGGAYSLELTDTGAGDSPLVRSDSIPVSAGDKVTAGVWADVGEYDGSAAYVDAIFSVWYCDADGNRIGQAWGPDIQANGGWTRYSSGELTVPAQSDGKDVAGVCVAFYGAGGGECKAYFDDAEVQVEGTQKDLYPKTLYASDCSSLTEMKDAGWTVDDPSEGNYTTDHAHSTGTLGGTLKDVPEGQVLFYMDSASGEGAVGAFKKVDSSNVIGSDPWKLELDMNFASLMTALDPNMQSGFSVLVDPGYSDKVFRVNFGGDSVIRVQSESGFQQESADLHIGDGTVHTWTLEGDRNGGLSISCDGESVASFSGAAVSGSWGEPGVQFIDYNNNVIGSNEIYFAGIRLSVLTENPGTGITAGTPVDLGTAVQGGKPLLLYSITARNPVTGSDELYTVTTGSEDKSSVFYACDPATGERLFSQPIPGTVHNYGIVRGSDGNIYFAGCDTGKLYRYVPGAKGEGKIEDLGENPSDTWVWDLDASEDGKIYGATSETDGGTDNGSKVFEYDIASGTFRDLGSAKAGAVYARGLGVAGDSLYVGVGMPDALIQIDRSDPDTKTEIPIPAFGETPGTGEDGRMCGHVWSYNGKLFIRDNAMKLFVLDADTHELLNVLSFQQAISSPSPYNGNLIYYKSGTALWQYDCSTNTAKQVESSPALSSDASNALNWFTPASGAKAGRALLGITDDAGGYTVYDPQENTASDALLDMEPQAVDVQSLEKGPDGKLYLGGYQFGASVFDPASGEIVNSAPRLDQPEGIGFLNGKVYFGTYGSAVIYGYDPKKPFAYGSGAGGNPGIAHDIGNDQDRPFAFASGDNKLFVGTVPDYGMLGGALTVYDDEKKTWTEYRNVVENQSVTGLAYHDGKLYGGTSVAGGTGAASAADEAKLFVWDVKTGKKIKETTIHIDGLTSTYEGTERTAPVMIGSLTFGSDSLLYGAADGALFAVDPDTLEVVKSKVLTSMDYDTDSAWRPFYLRWGADGLLYTTIGRRVSVFDTSTMAYDYLTGYAGLATLGSDGDIYYASGSRLMKVPLTRPAETADAFALGSLARAAQDAIDMLPGYYDITSADGSAVRAARTLVGKAVAAGAPGLSGDGLEKLKKCEQKLSQSCKGHHPRKKGRHGRNSPKFGFDWRKRFEAVYQCGH